MKVFIGCERSGIVREEYKKLGHNAWSCDLHSSNISGQHIQDNVLRHLNDGWDLAIFFPPCTRLAVSGAKWFSVYPKEQRKAIVFFMQLALAPIPKIAIENPIGIMSTAWRKPDQIIQPYEFGHGETKATCIWLKNLPLLYPTNMVKGRKHRIHENIPPSKNRGYLRSITYKGIAEAMAEQWG